jgi:hypothetical protein
MHSYDSLEAGKFWLVICTLPGNVWEASHVDGGNKENVVGFCILPQPKDKLER